MFCSFLSLCSYAVLQTASALPIRNISFVSLIGQINNAMHEQVIALGRDSRCFVVFELQTNC